MDNLELPLELPFGIRVTNDDALEARYLNGKIAYISIEEANTSIPVSNRHIGLFVNINKKLFWYEKGTADEDLKAFSLLISDSFYFLDGTLYSNISQITTPFVYYTGDPTIFTLPFTPTNLIAIFINGLKLYKAAQFNLILPNQIEIFQTLFDEDVIEFLYEHYNNPPI